MEIRQVGHRLLHALRDPADFGQRLLTLIEIRLDDALAAPPEPAEAVPWQQARSELGIGAFSPERDFTAELAARLASIATDPAFPTKHNADTALAECCYAVCRELRPLVVVETGVAFGVTSAHVLQALDENGEGVLHSVDFPPYGNGAREAVGSAVPDRLRSRWTLHRGRARAVLPRVLPSLGPVGLFIHDSLHTAYNIRRELEIVEPHLGPGAAVIADDIEGNTAFQRFVRRRAWRGRTVLAAEKNALFGIGLTGAAPAGR